jgi:hypothetical protein
MTDPRDLIKDAGYVAVGFGVIAFQKAQVRRRELEQQLDGTRKLVEERAGALGEQLDRGIEDRRTRIPEQAVEAFDTAVGAAKDATGQLLDLVRPASAA